MSEQDVKKAEKLWAGRMSGDIDRIAEEFNTSLPFDRRLYRQDIRGSMAHAEMLGAQGVISREDAEAIKAGLTDILAELDSGALQFDMSCEDIHTFIEQELTARVGDPGRRLHTARSRNDQVALDLRLYLRDECASLRKKLRALIRALYGKAKDNAGVIMPGYTHLQRAQPVTFGHHLLAYAMMFIRDDGRIADAVRRMNVSPIGCCALAGTTYPTDRELEAKLLGFDSVAMNSMDGVSDRDYCLELMSAFSICMMHLSRLAEELVLWSSWEFRFVELGEAYTTGSSIMPQKKNPDMAELVRGKTGRVYGDLISLLTTMKGLPLAYNKDMQEDKEPVFDSLDTLSHCLDVFAPMISSMRPLPDNMLRAAQRGFMNATDLADYLTGKGTPFRTAYKLSGELVTHCIQHNTTLEELPLEEYRQYSPLFEADLYEAIALPACVARRQSAGGPAPEPVAAQLAYVEEFLNHD